MKKQPSLYIISSLIILSVIGVIGKFIDNPVKFLQGVVVTGIVIGIMFLLIRKLVLNKPGNSEQKAFVKAARQSRKRLAQKGLDHSPRRPKPLVARRRSTAHLTVIEGNKGKKKNRAQF